MQLEERWRAHKQHKRDTELGPEAERMEGGHAEDSDGFGGGDGNGNTGGNAGSGRAMGGQALAKGRETADGVRPRNEEDA